MKLRVLVADDSVLYRRVLADVLSTLPGVEVVGTVGNGKLTLERVRELKPDLLTLDMEMPEMDGWTVLENLQKEQSPPAVLVVSGLTRRGSQLTVRALERGAFDFITKPETTNADLSREGIRRELSPRVWALAQRLEVRGILTRKTGLAPGKAHVEAKLDDRGRNGNGKSEKVAIPNRFTASVKPEFVLLGVSTGGPNALARVLPALPANLGVPILIVQHMPPIFTQTLAESLAAKSSIRVREAVHNESVEPNTAYIAPGGKQMRLAPVLGARPVLQITDDPPENNCRPAVDYLFRSAANHFPGRSMAVILTGMGSDGTLGLRLLKRHGCTVIAQDESSCVVYGMPKAAVDAGVTDAVLPLDAIARSISQVVRTGSL